MRQALAWLLALTTGLPAAPPLDASGDPLPAGALARLGTVRFRPGGHIRHLEFTPDGKRLLTYGPWSGVHVWDAATGREVATLPAARGSGARSAFLAKGGETICCTELKGRSWVVRQRRLADLQPLSEFDVGGFQAMGLSPDGRLVVGWVQEKGNHFTLELWDVAAGKKARSWPAHKGWVHAHAFSADGKTLVSAGDDKAIRFWDVATGTKRFEIADHPDAVGLLALSADGTTLASVGSGPASNPRVRLWDVPTRKETRHLDMPACLDAYGQPGGVTMLRFAPDGKTLVTAGHDGLLRFWDVPTGTQRRHLPLGTNGPCAFAFAPDGKTLALGTDAVRVLRATDGKDVVPLEGHRVTVQAAAWLADRRTVATAGDGAVVLWDAATGRQRGRLVEHEGTIAALRLLPDGRTLLGMDVARRLVLWDAGTGRELRRFQPANTQPLTYGGFALSPDGKTVAVNGTDKTLVLIDLGTGKEVARLPRQGEYLWGAAFSPDGRVLSYWDYELLVYVWDLKAGKEVRRYELPEAPPGGANLAMPAIPNGPGGKRGKLAYAATLSPDGRLIAYGTQLGYLALHDARTGRFVRSVEGLKDAAYHFAFSPDSRMLAWTHWQWSNTVHVVEVATGKERTRFVGHRGRVVAFEFAADSRTLLTGSEDTTALVWDVFGGGAKGPLDLDRCWADLADADAAKAFGAMRRLVESPDTVAYLRKRVVPVPAVARERLAKLIADLDAEAFGDRERASRELEKLGDVAEEACRTALAANPSAEVRKRLGRLLKPLDAKAEVPSADRLRLMRAVEVLERLPSPDAGALLKAVAGGAAGAFLTRQAADAVGRR